jgi:hypothetical protein
MLGRMWNYHHVAPRPGPRALTVLNGLSLAWAALYWSGAPAVIAGCACALVVATCAMRDARWGLWLSCATALHVHIGIGLGLYLTTSWFDLALHAATTAWLVVLTSSVLMQRGLASGVWPVCAVAVMLALGFGAAWELFEASIDALFALGAQLDLHDTNLDLFADLSGGLIASLVLSRSDAIAGTSVSPNRSSFVTPLKEISNG